MEDNLSCAVCHDLYKDPVLLDCGHSFCRSCITQYWEKTDTASCPVCRKESARTLRLNLTRSNIVETFVKSDEGDKIQLECSRHQEKLKVFCKTDNQPICVVCQISKSHQNHEMLPAEEAAEEFKEELQTLLKPIQDKKEEWNTVRSEREKTLTHIQDQSVTTEKQIKAEFEKLHQFLHEEERIVLEDLKLKKEKKSQEMKERIEKITEEISSLSVTVQDIEQELSEQDNIKFLMKFPDIQKRVKQTLPEPQKVYPLINVGKYIGSLQYRVWKKMLTVINTAPVTFDPNTANLYLRLSEDLSTVRNIGKWEQLPNNPERFDRCPCVLGLEGFTSGKHSWEVDVGNMTQWNVGVAKESISRKGQIYLSPSNGYWAMALRDENQYLACDEPWKNLDLSVKLRQIQVCLDYEGGKVSFYNSDNKAHIYTFTGTFTEKLYPFFSPCFNIEGKNPDPLKICPLTVTILEDKDCDQSFEMEADLPCAVCHDLYENPVLIDCDHAFCQSSLTKCWEKAVTASCPVCSQETSSRDLRPIRTLSNNMETFVKRDKGDEIQQKCSHHKEKLKLFCKTDNQPICAICHSSKNHLNHKVVSAEEAAEEFKEGLRTFLKPVQKEEWSTVKSDYEKALAHIQNQSVKTEKQIKAEFEKLHQFLCEEERIVLEDLKLEKEKKSQEMKERIEKITEEISSLSVTVQDIEQELSEQDNIKFFTKFPDIQKRMKQTLPEPQKVYPLINVGKYIGSLQYRVWKKMLMVINTAPVTFDSNTAHPYLRLSADLSTVRYTGKRQQLPDNPERFDPCACVLGSEGFTSGKHSWEVEVGNKTDWDVGVAKESIDRKGKITALTPGNGYWTMILREGNKYWACEKSLKPLQMGVNPRKIRVCLDYERGKVSFYNSDNKSHIYTFTGTFTEKLYPYFCPCNTDGGKNAEPLKICPQTVTIQEEMSFIPSSK
ncbi:uncharacterized protein LOC144497611 [Mustelus asterias]